MKEGSPLINAQRTCYDEKKQDTTNDVFSTEFTDFSKEEKTVSSDVINPELSVSDGSTVFSPDGRVMVEDSSKKSKGSSKKKRHLRKEKKMLIMESDGKKKAKYLAKLEKKNRKRAKKDKKRNRKLEFARIKASVRIAKPEARLEFIKNQMMTESAPGKLKKLKKKKNRLEARIAKINLSTISTAQRSTTDKLRIKIKGFHILVTSRASSLEDEVSDLKDKNSKLTKKANFMDNHIKVVEDDSNKTYHIYGCTKANYSSFWAYNKEQVINNSKYTKCPYCQ